MMESARESVRPAESIAERLEATRITCERFTPLPIVMFVQAGTATLVPPPRILTTRPPSFCPASYTTKREGASMTRSSSGPPSLRIVARNFMALLVYGPQDLLERGGAARGLVEAVLEHGEHTLLLRLRLDSVGGALVQDDVADSGGYFEDFVDADAALIAVSAFWRRH